MLRATSLLLILVLAGCGRGWAVKPTPPLVTPCLEEPSAHVPDEPQAPPDGAPITDAYVRDLKAWSNALLGVIVDDRLTWRSERRCIGRLQDAGQVQ